MAKDRNTIEMRRGDTYPFFITITDKTTGALTDLTGCTVHFTVDSREDPDDDSTQIFSLVGVVTTPLSGVAVVTPSALDTAQIGDFWYDVQVTDAGGFVRTPIKAPFLITQDITK